MGLQWGFRTWNVLRGGREPASARAVPRAGQAPGGEKEQRVTSVRLWKLQLTGSGEGGQRQGCKASSSERAQLGGKASGGGPRWVINGSCSR